MLKQNQKKGMQAFNEFQMDRQKTKKLKGGNDSDAPTDIVVEDIIES